MTDYSKIEDLPPNMEEKLISDIKKDDVFYAKGFDDPFKAIDNAYLTENRSHWVLNAETVDFDTKTFVVKKSELVYAEKLRVVIQ